MRLKFCASAVAAAIIAISFVCDLHAGDGGASGRADIDDVYVVHFVIDGLNLGMFEETLSQGRLPAIEGAFVDGGARFTRAVTSFPSTSTAVYQGFATGLFPGHAGIPHLERFDRLRRRVIDYLTARGHAKLDADLINLRALTNPDVADMDAATSIFDLLRGYPTAAIYTSFQRGASHASPRRAPIAALWDTYVTGEKEHVDVLALRKVMDLFMGDEARIPRYNLVGLYSADILGHSHGPRHESIAAVLVQFDSFLKEFMELLARRGIAEKTYIIVSADHGMHASGELFDFQGALKERGILVKPKNPRAKGYTLYAASRGVASSHIYVEHDGGFAPLADADVLRRHPARGQGTVDLIDLILGLDATDLLVVRAGERKVKVFSRDGGQADISCYTIDSTDYCSYEFDRRRHDPLGYSPERDVAALMDGKPHSSRAWLGASAGLRYPDAVIGLSQVFHDGRSGDAFITTRERWGFKRVKAGNHGGALRDDMCIPLFMRGPTVPRGTFGPARAVDVYALLISWFGLDVPRANHDGVDPFVAPDLEDERMQRLASLEQSFDRHLPLPAQPRSISRLAREELARRERLVAGLRRLRAGLEGRKDGRALRPMADPEYLGDHVEIVGRTLKWAEDGKLRMEGIVSALVGQAARGRP